MSNQTELNRLQAEMDAAWWAAWVAAREADAAWAAAREAVGGEK